MTCKDCIHNEVCHMREICNDIEEQIKELGCMDFIARADVAEVKYAHWTDAVSGCWHCSECLHPILLNGGEEYVFSNYCPHCGAKMDGGNNNA